MSFSLDLFGTGIAAVISTQAANGPIFLYNGPVSEEYIRSQLLVKRA